MVVRDRTGCCIGGVALGGGIAEVPLVANVKGGPSGKGSDLNTFSKRARLKFDSFAKPTWAGVVSNSVILDADSSLKLNWSRSF